MLNNFSFFKFVFKNNHKKIKIKSYKVQNVKVTKVWKSVSFLSLTPQSLNIPSFTSFLCVFPELFCTFYIHLYISYTYPIHIYTFYTYPVHLQTRMCIFATPTSASHTRCCAPFKFFLHHRMGLGSLFRSVSVEPSISF